MSLFLFAKLILPYPGPSPPTENFLKPVCGISAVKRKITPVFTEVISYLERVLTFEPAAR